MARTNYSRVLTALSVMVTALVAASGVALAARDISCPPSSPKDPCQGTNRSDWISGTDGNDYIYGFDNYDVISGGLGKDTLYGGRDEDQLDGGPGADVLKGGRGRDSYRFDYAFGNDTIVDAPDPDNDYFTGNRIGLTTQSVDPSRTENVVIDLRAGPGPEVTEGTDTINWGERNIIDNVFVRRQKTTVVTITGNDNANYLKSDKSVATIASGKGDDLISVQDSEPGDIVDCGEDPDGRDADIAVGDPEDILNANCESHDTAPPPVPEN